MLEINVPPVEMWDQKREIFVQTKAETLQLEHSLISLSKWEAKWCKPFLQNNGLTQEETIDYVRCMTINKISDPSVYYRIPKSESDKIKEYITAPMTATWFNDTTRNGSGRGRKPEIITSEILYYDMIALNIPFECQKWHLNRLLTLIKVCEEKNDPKKNKMSRKETMLSNKALNEARKAKLNTKG